jgi:hypothetical protein
MAAGLLREFFEKLAILLTVEVFSLTIFAPEREGIAPEWGTRLEPSVQRRKSRLFALANRRRRFRARVDRDAGGLSLRNHREQ